MYPQGLRKLPNTIWTISDPLHHCVKSFMPWPTANANSLPHAQLDPQPTKLTYSNHRTSENGPVFKWHLNTRQKRLVFKWHFGICGPKPFEIQNKTSGFLMLWVHSYQNNHLNPRH